MCNNLKFVCVKKITNKHILVSEGEVLTDKQVADLETDYKKQTNGNLNTKKYFVPEEFYIQLESLKSSVEEKDKDVIDLKKQIDDLESCIDGLNLKATANTIIAKIMASPEVHKLDFKDEDRVYGMVSDTIQEMYNDIEDKLHLSEIVVLRNVTEVNFDKKDELVEIISRRLVDQLCVDPLMVRRAQDKADKNMVKSIALRALSWDDREKFSSLRHQEQLDWLLATVSSNWEFEN